MGIQKLILLGILLANTSLAETFNWDVSRKTDGNQSLYQINNMLPTEPVSIENEDISIIVTGLTDSRCSPGKVCLWEGSVNLNVKIIKKDYQKDVTLMYQDSCSHVTQIDAYELTIVDVNRKYNNLYDIKLKLIQEDQ